MGSHGKLGYSFSLFHSFDVPQVVSTCFQGRTADECEVTNKGLVIRQGFSMEFDIPPAAATSEATIKICPLSFRETKREVWIPLLLFLYFSSHALIQEEKGAYHCYLTKRSIPSCTTDAHDPVNLGKIYIQALKMNDIISMG